MEQKGGFTALVKATRQSRAEVVELLLNNNADVNSASHVGVFSFANSLLLERC